ncbi:unnamed protein product [Paramecium sonneborni]|uniref:Uncharacterized protein n=1 Tax=Paramecium sonneborni TaxID=65129 RepID=A0A8S1Q1R7_9CILI|nr:unnamed protein product [Paramecium sonneborni]
MQNKPNAYDKTLRNLQEQSNYIFKENPNPILNYQSKLVLKQYQISSFIQRQEQLNNQLNQTKKSRQFSQQQERQTVATKPRAFSIYYKDQICTYSQPNLIKEDSNNSTDDCVFQKNEYQSNNFFIYSDESLKKKRLLPPMHLNNKDPFLQTFGKQIETINKNRFPKEVFLGNVRKMKKQFQQNLNP